MELNDFPRPTDDTGIGVQWSLGYPAMIGLSRLEQRWIPLLRALGVRWVKFRQPGGVGFARLLIDHGIMPIVHLWPRQSHPGKLSTTDIETVRQYVDAGARYFELGPGLDVPPAWPAGPDGGDRAGNLHDLLSDLETILREGGLPGLPAGAQVVDAADLIGAICTAGKADLLQAGVWQAHHVAAGNLPLDFPNDPVNEQGKPVSEDEFRRGFAETWEGATWGGRTRNAINIDRLRRRNPAASIQDRPVGWRSHEFLDARIRRHMGRSIPILATSGGCAVGDATDSRYPIVSPNGHAARTLEMARIMMGTSQRFEPAPGYLFCVAFSLLGNYALSHFEPRWEPRAWISPTRKNGRLPVVDLLSREPKRSRWDKGVMAAPDVTAFPFVMPVGTRQFSDTQPPAASTEPEASEEELELVAPAVGRPLRDLLTPPDWEAGGGEGSAAPVIPSTFAEEPFAFQPAASIVGRLVGGAGQVITLRRPKDSSSITQTVSSSGTFAFRELRPGEYTLSVEQTNLYLDRLQVTSGEERQLTLNMPEWRWQLTRFDGDKGFSIVRCSVEGQTNLPVRIWNVHWAGIEGRTGSKPEYGPFYCELAPLGPGRYQLAAAGITPHVELELDGKSILHVEFVRTARAGEEPALPAPQTGKGLPSYLLLARPFSCKEDLLAVLRFMRIHQPVCGFSIEEARWADNVLVVGADGLRVTQRDYQLLEASGCRVHRVDENIAEAMTRLADMGDPFIER